MDLKGKKILFLGDSITAGVGASSPENCFVGIIEKETGAVCKNLGIGSTCVSKELEPIADSDPMTGLTFNDKIFRKNIKKKAM